MTFEPSVPHLFILSCIGKPNGARVDLENIGYDIVLLWTNCNGERNSMDAANKRWRELGVAGGF
jgi:hypothetical protein